MVDRGSRSTLKHASHILTSYFHLCLLLASLQSFRQKNSQVFFFLLQAETSWKDFQQKNSNCFWKNALEKFREICQLYLASHSFKALLYLQGVEGGVRVLFAAQWKLIQIYQPARVGKNSYLHVLARAAQRFADTITGYSHFIKWASTSPTCLCLGWWGWWWVVLNTQLGRSMVPAASALFEKKVSGCLIVFQIH